MNKLSVVVCSFILMILISGCNEVEEKTELEKIYESCESNGGEIKHDSQCYLQNGIIITPNQKIDLNNCKSYYNGCNECQIIDSNTFNLECDTEICFTYEEPICRDSEFREQNIECTQEDLPVCGIDGITYPNKCIARENDIQIRTFGAC